jgi:vitamin B12 transporter
VQNPTLTELFGFDGNFVGNPDLNPETSTGWDIGVEQQLFNGRVTADATWFNNRIKDFISSSFDPVAGASQPVNLDGRSKIHGLELSLSARLLEQLDFNASYTYTNSQDPTGAELVRRPKHIASAALNYRFLAKRANLNLEVQYNGSQEDLVFIAPFFEQGRAKLDAYTLVNLAASYRLMKGVELTGRVENLLDKDYEELYGYRSPGITGYIGIKGEFGL